MPTLKPLSILALVAVLGGCGLIRSNTQFIADRDAACAKHRRILCADQRP